MGERGVPAGAPDGDAGLPASGAAAAAVVETHISVLFLVGDRAYKLKKPVTYPFVDQSTRAARRALCHREVELNRRLAPDVYLGVLDVVGPDGEVEDHLVAMRRMPDDRRLAPLVTSGDPRARAAVAELGPMLARFHRDAARSPAADAAARADAVAARWRENFEELRPFVGPVLDAATFTRAERLAARYLAGRGALFDERIAAGCSCDGHGDLQADDVFCLDDGPRVLDCIEFADEYRYGDVAADLAFLVMDLERLGAPDLAAALVAGYEAEAGAVLPPSLLRFFVAYRAQVRAKVACLRAAQEEPAAPGTTEASGRARGLLERCVAALEEATVTLVLVGGLPGTGKTTLAAELATRCGADLERSDVVRKERAGLPATESAAAPFGHGLYAPEVTDAVYGELAERATRLLGQGRRVVIDASFSAERHRRRLREVAHATASDLIELRCVLEPDEAARRIRARAAAGGDASDADESVALAMAARADPWPEARDVSTAAAPDVIVDELLRTSVRPGRSGAGPGTRAG